jgi:hypothetical protein
MKQARAQRGQVAGQPREWSQERAGQKPQQDTRRAVQRPATTGQAPQEILNSLFALIRARFGDVAIRSGGTRDPL